MGKIKTFFQKSSLKKSFAIYILACIFIALIISIFSSSLCQFGQNQIYKKYQLILEDDYKKEGQIVTSDGNNTGTIIGYYTQDIKSFYSYTEKVIDKILNILNIWLVPLWFAICIIVTSLLFYKKKLQKPLEILDYATDNISNNNLAFSILYDKQDEMGKLCSSFEKMRFALEKNNIDMWRKMEERKRLNAAFSHDLRTPLTVLKGYTDMLCKYVPEGKLSEQKIAQTANTMSEHISRLESYVNGMSSLQKLEDTEFNPTSLDSMAFIQQLKDTAIILCDKITVHFIDGYYCNKINIDEQIILRVYNNLLSNAVRYAKNTVNISFKTDNDKFIIMVSDDGDGFDKNSLDKATNPFYKAKENIYDNHFGIGLNICKILCEKHYGEIIISNNSGGGAYIIVTFKIK